MCATPECCDSPPEMRVKKPNEQTLMLAQPMSMEQPGNIGQAPMMHQPMGHAVNHPPQMVHEVPRANAGVGATDNVEEAFAQATAMYDAQNGTGEANSM